MKEYALVFVDGPFAEIRLCGGGDHGLKWGCWFEGVFWVFSGCLQGGWRVERWGFYWRIQSKSVWYSCLMRAEIWALEKCLG